MHLADAFIQSDSQYIQVIHLLSVCVFPGNWTHDLCAANAMLYHWATETYDMIYTFKSSWQVHIYELGSRNYNIKLHVYYYYYNYYSV